MYNRRSNLRMEFNSAINNCINCTTYQSKCQAIICLNFKKCMVKSFSYLLQIKPKKCLPNFSISKRTINIHRINFIIIKNRKQ